MITQSQHRAALDKHAHKRYAAAKPVNATPSRTHVNSAMEGTYTASKAPVRAGADDHAAIQSKGL